MRPNQQEYEPSSRYRRRQRSGSNNIVRFSLIAAVAVGLVIVSVVIASTYDFNRAPDPGETARNTPGNGGQQGAGGSNSGAGGIRSTVAPGSSNSSDSIASSGGPGDAPVNPNSTPSSTGSTGLPGLPGENAGPGSSGSTLPNGQSSTRVGTATCDVHGRVTDDWGSPMVGVVVRALTADGTVSEIVTDARGRYTLPGTNTELASVSVVLSHGLSAEASFAVMNGKSVISLTTSGAEIESTASAGCEFNFDTWNVGDNMIASPIATALWPDAVTIFQYTRNAELLARSFGAEIDLEPTLQVQVWCEDPKIGCTAQGAGAFFIAENGIEEGSPPIIAMTPGRSSAESPGIPDNREYHEYGHYFLSLQTGENFELKQGDRNHGGYYLNSSTRDSFVEGFAEFYSMMVSRRIDGDDRAEIYTIGAGYDLEMDRLPWEAAGWWEEFTVAGLLLDLVDDDGDYAARAQPPTGVSVSEISTNVEPSGTIVVGKVVNSSPLVIRNTDVTVRYINAAGELVGTQVTKILPEVIAPTRESTFFAAPPQGVNVSAATASVGGIAKIDDDRVALGMQQVLDTITKYERADGVGVSNVAELYDALVGGVDSLLAGSELIASQVDDLFVRHGFFADLDGDNKYDPNIDGAIGDSSHPVKEIGGVFYPSLIPRHDPEGFEGSFVKINTGDEDVDAIIQIAIPGVGGANSYAYVTSIGGSSNVELAVPPAGQNADVTIITAGKGFKPVIAFRVDADDFHEQVQNGTISDLQVIPVKLEPGTSISDAAANNSNIQLGIIVGGIIAVMVVVGSLIAIRRQWG
ncbi:MAG: carboxypeptidase-like regulatory domain-containing protein [Chloroflexi bacterium]|nr:carboxypeptidase-like regulatory domain-containing protein [Chloroflexota bacterium]